MNSNAASVDSYPFIPKSLSAQSFWTLFREKIIIENAPVSCFPVDQVLLKRDFYADQHLQKINGDFPFSAIDDFLKQDTGLDK